MEPPAKTLSSAACMREPGNTTSARVSINAPLANEDFFMTPHGPERQMSAPVKEQCDHDRPLSGG